MSIRILHLVRHLEFTGEGRNVELLVEGMQAGEFDIHVACFGEMGPLAARLMAAGHTVHAVPMRGRLDVSAWWRTRRLVARLAPAVLHAWESPADPSGRFFGAAQAVRTVTTIRQLVGEDRRQRRVALRLARRSERVVVNCQAMEDRLKEFGVPDERIVVIPPAAALHAASAACPLPPELAAANAKFILVVGEISRRRHAYDLAHAFDIMAINWPELHLVFAGDGPLRARVESHVRTYRAAERIHFLGRRDDVTQLMRRAVAYWHADEADGISQALLEALAAGVPVVARDSASLREVISHGQTGYLARADWLMAFCKWQQEILAHPEAAARIGQAGREMALGRFSAAEFVLRHDALYREVVPRFHDR